MAESGRSGKKVGDLLGRTRCTLKIPIEESCAVVTHDQLPMVVAGAGQLECVFHELITTTTTTFKGEDPPRASTSPPPTRGAPGALPSATTVRASPKRTGNARAASPAPSSPLRLEPDARRVPLLLPLEVEVGEGNALSLDKYLIKAHIEARTESYTALDSPKTCYTCPFFN